jgi:hypothetical protein
VLLELRSSAALLGLDRSRRRGIAGRLRLIRCRRRPCGGLTRADPHRLAQELRERPGRLLDTTREAVSVLAGREQHPEALDALGAETIRQRGGAAVARLVTIERDQHTPDPRVLQGRVQLVGEPVRAERGRDVP